MRNELEITTLLELLAENEEAIGRLYTTYANIFPKKRAFWLDLASEESNHARMLRSLRDLPLPLQTSIPVSDIKDLLKVSFDYIAGKQTQAQNGRLKIKEAVTTALELETSMLERGSFEFLNGRSTELSKLSEALTSETKNHCERIRKELERKRWSFF
jgi:rubrerythrin